MAHVDNLRRHFPAVRYVTYLNTGSFGALPDVTINAMQQSLATQLEHGRNRLHAEAIGRVKQQVREELGKLLNAPADHFALTHNTTEALNIALWGLDLVAGDEILLSDQEHPAAVLAAINLRHRIGVKLRTFPGSQPEDEVVAAMERNMTRRTRVVICSHVSYATGQVLPIGRMAEACRRRGAVLLVDGAQSVGAMPVDLTALAVDFYALPGQKWTLGPDGTGALYIHPMHLQRLLPTIIGVPAMRDAQAYDPSGYYLPAQGGQRFEYEIAGLERWTGWLQSLQFLRVTVGHDYGYTRIHGLSGECIDGLLDVSGVSVRTPREARAGIVSFGLAHVDAKTFVAEATSRQIDIRAVDYEDSVRVSTGLYNSSDDVERLLRLVREQARG